MPSLAEYRGFGTVNSDVDSHAIAANLYGSYIFTISHSMNKEGLMIAANPMLIYCYEGCSTYIPD